MDNIYKQEIIDIINRLERWIDRERDNIAKSGKRQYYLSKIFAYKKVRWWLETRLRVLEMKENEQ